MSKKDIKNNTNIYTSPKRRRPGLFSSFNGERPYEEKPYDEDTKNRNDVLKRIVNHVHKGGNIDDILDVLCSDEEINKQFKYLTDNGLNLRNTFETWYKGYEKSRKQKMNWYTMREMNRFEENEEENEYR